MTISKQIVHAFSKDEASFEGVKKALKNFENSRNLQTRIACNEKVVLLSKGKLRKFPCVNLESSLGNVGVAVKVDINKPLVEYPSATFACVLAVKRIYI